MIALADNGNSAIVSYSLEMDDGIGGDFVEIGGLSSNSMLTTYTVVKGIERGKTYGFRYRTLNGAGWSDYSSILYAIAATIPSRPPAPTFVSATGTSIALSFKESSNNGGAKMTAYELWMDAGTLGSAFSIVASYTDNSMAHTVTAGIVAGTTYTFKFRS